MVWCAGPLCAVLEFALGLMVLECLEQLVRAGYPGLAIGVLLFGVGLAMIARRRNAYEAAAVFSSPKSGRGLAVFHRLSPAD